MSRLRWLIVASGLAFAVACSFEASSAAAKDKRDPKKTTAGGQPPSQPKQVAPAAPKQVAPAAPRQVAPALPKQVQPQPTPKAVVPSTQPPVGKSSGTPLQPFQPNKGEGTALGGKPVVGGSIPGTTAPGTKPVVGTGTPGITAPGGKSPAGRGTPGTGFPPEVPGANDVNAKGSIVKPKISVEPNAGKGTGSLTGALGGGNPNGDPLASTKESRSNLLKSFDVKPKLIVEPGTQNPTLGGKGGIAAPGTNVGIPEPTLKVGDPISGVDLGLGPKGKPGRIAVPGKSGGIGTGNPTLGGTGGNPEPPGKSKDYNLIKSNTLTLDTPPNLLGNPVSPIDPKDRAKTVSGSKSNTSELMLNKDGKMEFLPVPKPGRKLSGGPATDIRDLLVTPKEGRVGAAADGKDQSVVSPKDDKLHSLLQAKKRGELSHELKQLRESPDPQANAGLKHLNLDKISGVHQERLAKLDNFQHWQQSNVGQKLGLQQQFALQHQGDLSRRMNLSQNLLNAGGWAQHRQHGVIAAGFTTGAFSMWYAGGGCYPTHSWCPTWSPWVDWSYWGTCPILYDPRPYYCIPIVYEPCVPWVYYDYPVWHPLPLVSCGTWIDVSPVVVVAGQDVQLLAVRFVDNGHPEQNQGPRYRVWARNNSPNQIVTPFSVLLLASNEQTPTVELPQTGVVIPSMDIGETQVLDIRLPLAANRLGTTPEGYRVPFTYLHALVDSHQQIPETFENNNGAVLLRSDILPVDPAAFSTDLTAAAPESLLTIAGEGFGPEPGQVIVSVYGQQVQAEIHGWYDLGIRFAVPNFELTQPVDVEVLVVRGDSAVSNPLTVRLAPKEMLAESAVLPESPIPDPPQ